MTQKELNKIILGEMWRDGYLSKGTRIAIIEHARDGEVFSFVGSETDRKTLSPAMSKMHNLTTTKIAPNRVLFTINK